MKFRLSSLAEGEEDFGGYDVVDGGDFSNIDVDGAITSSGYFSDAGGSTNIPWGPGPAYFAFFDGIVDAFDHNGDGDLWDESSMWFGGAAGTFALGGGLALTTPIPLLDEGALFGAAAVSGGMAGLLGVGDFYFG